MEQEVDAAGMPVGDPQKDNFEVLWGNGRSKYMHSVETPGLGYVNNFEAAFAGTYMATYSKRAPNYGFQRGAGGYGFINDEQGRHDRGGIWQTTPRYGAWLFGFGVYEKDPEKVNLADVLLAAPVEQVHMEEVDPTGQGKRLVKVTANLGSGDYTLILDPAIDYNIVEMDVRRDKDLHSELPEDWGLDRIAFHASDIRYEEIDGRWFPVDCRMTEHRELTLNGKAAAGDLQMALHLSDVEWKEGLTDKDFELDWPEDVIVLDEKTGLQYLTGANGSKMPYEEGSPANLEAVVKAVTADMAVPLAPSTEAASVVTAPISAAAESDEGSDEVQTYVKALWLSGAVLVGTVTVLFLNAWRRRKHLPGSSGGGSQGHPAK